MTAYVEIKKQRHTHTHSTYIITTLYNCYHKKLENHRFGFTRFLPIFTTKISLQRIKGLRATKSVDAEGGGRKSVNNNRTHG